MMNTLKTGKIKAIFDEEFENIFLNITIDAFNELGFSFGDSIDVHFENGTIIKDIPYYSGYYCGVEELMLCGYPGDPFIKLARNCGDPTWYEFKMNNDDKLEIVLNEKNKYLEIEELFSLEYSDDLNDFTSLEAYCNFRELKGGNIKEKAFYRSASPCDNWHHRGTPTDTLVKKYNIQCVLNLSNSQKKYESFLEKGDFNSPYYHSLYNNGDVLLLLLNVNYRSDEFKQKVALGLYEMTKHSLPVLIHCAEGKDRTGFVSALIMSLANVKAQDIINDYMMTYENYYQITKENEPKKYEAILENIYDFLYSMSLKDRGVDLNQIDLKVAAKNYLKQGGLLDQEILEIEKYINK